jgi:hypothetical protein
MKMNLFSYYAGKYSRCCSDRFMGVEKGGEMRVMIGEDMSLNHAYLGYIMSAKSNRH